MRRHNFPDHDSSARAEWSTISTLLPYLLEYKGRVALAIILLVLAKLANVAVPLALTAATGVGLSFFCTGICFIIFTPFLYGQPQNSHDLYAN